MITGGNGDGQRPFNPPRLRGGGPRSGGGGSPHSPILRFDRRPLRHALRARHLPTSGEDLIVDGYAGWIALAVVAVGIIGGLWGRRSKK